MMKFPLAYDDQSNEVAFHMPCSCKRSNSQMLFTDTMKFACERELIN